MTNAELILALNNLPQDMEVCITDWRKNAFNATDEGCGIGIEPKFSISVVNENVNKPFIALSFENDDYNEDCTPNQGSLIYAEIVHGVQMDA